MSQPEPESDWRDRHRAYVERLEKRGSTAFQATERFFKFIQWFLVLILLRFLADSTHSWVAHALFLVAWLVYGLCLFFTLEGFFERVFLRSVRREKHYRGVAPVFAGLLSLLLSFIGGAIYLSVDAAQVLYRR